MQILNSALSIILCYVCLSHGLSDDDFGTGTIELVHRSRTSRLNKEFLTPEVAASTSPDEAAAVARNEYKAKVLAEYHKLMEMNPKNLTAQQKHLLETIVTRAARLGGIDVAGAGEGRAHQTAATTKASSATLRPTTKGSTKSTTATTKRIKAKASVATNKPTTMAPTTATNVTPSRRPNDTLASKLAHPPNTTLPVQVREDIFSPELNATAIMDTLSRNNEQPELYKQAIDMKKKKDPSGKPTKYHYYPHNQHMYLLPECAIQQVCNAVYVRLNFTQPLCACPPRYRDPCSASLNEDDLHTTKLIGDGRRKAITLAKTCEAVSEMRECRAPKDWSLLALQNTRTGKSHYLVICKCPANFKLEGPMAHDQPTYASVPGIRVFGMMCVKPGFSIGGGDLQAHKQFQKPYFSNNKYGNIEKRPETASHVQHQYQPANNYQYLKRPESQPSSSMTTITNPYRGTVVSKLPFTGVYGRENKDEATEVEVETQPQQQQPEQQPQQEEVEEETVSEASDESETETERQKRSLDYDVEDPEIPWHRVKEIIDTSDWELP